MHFRRNSASLSFSRVDLTSLTLVVVLLFMLSTSCLGIEFSHGPNLPKGGTTITAAKEFDWALYDNDHNGRNLVLMETTPSRRQVTLKFDKSIWAREITTTTVSHDGNSMIGSFRRERSDGSSYVASLYDENHRLVHCEMRTDLGEVHKFIKTLSDETADEIKGIKYQECLDASEIEMNIDFSQSLIITPTQMDNAIIKPTTTCFYFDDPTEVPEHLRSLLDIATARSDCQRWSFRNYGQPNSKFVSNSSTDEMSRHEGVSVTFDMFDESDNTNTSIGRYVPPHRQSQSRDRGQRQIQTQSRARRSLLIYPGTLWCGAGDRAESVYALGEHAFTDRCCREHDLACPRVKQITRWATKYYLTNNVQPFTLSHCQCDKRFHKCLRQVRNEVSYAMGDIYFNKLDSRCFVLRSRRQCVKKGWWGKCEKYEKRLTAVVRRPRRFPTSLVRNRTKSAKVVPVS